jgi:CRP/FNR family cyclic AMP-dependent transcriptional regulator
MSEMEHRAGSPSAAEQHEIGELIVRGLPGALAETISVLLETARVWMARRDETVYRQGEPVPLTLIVHGYGAFRRTTEDGHDLMVGVGEPGDLFGFSSMAPVQSSVELVALTDCLVAQWPGAEIRKLAVDDPGLALRAAESMAESLHAVIERVEGFLHQDARRRVVRILARHRDLFFGESAVLTRAHLPSLVGTSREMTGRVLRQLEREGTITRVGRAGLRLLRPDRLGADAA